MTSDETSTTPDHLDSLGAMKLQPGGDSVKERELTSRTAETESTKVRGNAGGIRLHVGKSKADIFSLTECVLGVLTS